MSWPVPDAAASDDDAAGAPRRIGGTGFTKLTISELNAPRNRDLRHALDGDRGPIGFLEKFRSRASGS
jgi:hypothetical protein